MTDDETVQAIAATIPDMWVFQPMGSFDPESFESAESDPDENYRWWHRDLGNGTTPLSAYQQNAAKKIAEAILEAITPEQALALAVAKGALVVESVKAQPRRMVGMPGAMDHFFEATPGGTRYVSPWEPT